MFHMALRPILNLFIAIYPCMAVFAHNCSDTAPDIFLPDDAIEQEHVAASELAKYLGKMTGKTYSVVHTMGPKVGFFVGRSPAIEAILHNVDWEGLGGDGIVIRTVDRKLLLSGGRPRGTRNAVYVFLEEHMGCRWWTPTEETIPQVDELQIPELDLVYRPPFDFRAIISEGASRKPYAFKVRNNGSETKFDPDGESILKYLLPWRKLFVDHPDWFMYDPNPGDLKKKYTFSMGLDQLEKGSKAYQIAKQTNRLPYQPCMTSKGALAAATKAAMKRLEEQYPIMANYPPRVLWVVQQDGKWMCRCKNCSEVRKHEGSDSANWIRFLNSIADHVKRKYPDVLIGMHAYLHTNKPPKTVRPRDNVLIYMASLDRDHGKDFSQLPNGERLKEWCRIAKQVWVWDYDTNFRNYIMPHPNHQVTTRTIQFCVEAGVTGYRCQGALGKWSDLVYMRGWVNTRLAWDPTLDPEALREEYLNGYFGPAGPHLQKYLATMQRILDNKFLSCYTETTEPWLDLKNLSKLTMIFNEAARTVARNEPYARRLKIARRSLDVVWLERYHELKAEAENKGLPFLGPKDPGGMIDEFESAQKKIGHYRERHEFPEYVKKLRKIHPADSR